MSTKRRHVEDGSSRDSNDLDHREGLGDKRRKLEGEYSFRRIHHWLLSKLPLLPTLFAKTEEHESASRPGMDHHLSRITRHDSIGIGSRTRDEWTFVSPPDAPLLPKVRERDRQQRSPVRLRKRKLGRVLPIRSSHVDRTSGPNHATTATAVEASVAIEEHEKMDARLLEVSDRLQDLIRIGQDALSSTGQEG